MPDPGAAFPFGVYIPQGWRTDFDAITDPSEQYEAMTLAAQEAERLGFDSIWLYDHFHTVPQPTRNTTFECLTSLAGLARDTQRVKLGQMAVCNGYRNPALLAKISSTLDVMSHGRLILGLGAGWYEHEYRAYGYGFPDTRERLRRLREGCEIVGRMWTEDAPEFQGEYYAIDKPINEPKGTQQPHPPLWVAGSGEQVTLKVVARWGDGCNITGMDPANLRHKLDVLRRHCDALGRDYDSITRSVNVPMYIVESEASAERELAPVLANPGYSGYLRNGLMGTAAQIVERLQPLVDAGAQYFIAYLPRIASDPIQLQRLASDVMPHLRTATR